MNKDFNVKSFVEEYEKQMNDADKAKFLKSKLLKVLRASRLKILTKLLLHMNLFGLSVLVKLLRQLTLTTLSDTSDIFLQRNSIEVLPKRQEFNTVVL